MAHNGFSSVDLLNFFEGAIGSTVLFFTTGGVVRVRLLITVEPDGFVVAVVIERDRYLVEEVCTRDGFDVDGGRIAFFVVVVFADATAREDGTVESFFVFAATDV